MDNIPSNLTSAKIEKHISVMSDALDKCIDNFQRLDISDKAGRFSKACEVLGRKDIAIKCGELMVRAEYDVAQNSPSKQGQRNIGIQHPEVSNEVIRKIRQTFGKMPKDVFEDKLQGLIEDDTIPTRQGFGVRQPVRFIPGNYEFYTPSSIMKPVRNILGPIDLDPASCERANRTVEAKKYFTKDDDGLKQDWKLYKTVFTNPPYQQPNLLNFARKFCFDVERGCFLGPQDFSTEWSKWLIAFCDCYFFPTPKIKFIDARGECKTNLASVLFFRGVSPDVVSKEFVKAKVEGTTHLCRPPDVREFGAGQEIPYPDLSAIQEIKKLKLLRSHVEKEHKVKFVKPESLRSPVQSST